MKDKRAAGLFPEEKYGEAVERASGAGGRVVLPPGTVAALRDGDHGAFETVFHTFYSRVKAFIRTITRSQELAEEVSQGVFISLWTGREKLDPGRNPEAYIYTIARNSAISALKQQARFDGHALEYYDCSDGTLTDDELIARETEMLMRVTVAAMPRRRQQVYRMSRYEEKSNEEIARELNISKKVVERHLRLAISKLREAVKLMLLVFC